MSYSWYILLFFNSEFQCGTKLIVHKIYISKLLLWNNCNIVIEAVTWRCSVKKVFLEIWQNSQENTCARVSFLIKLQTRPGGCFWSHYLFSFKRQLAVFLSLWRIDDSKPRIKIIKRRQVNLTERLFCSINRLNVAIFHDKNLTLHFWLLQLFFYSMSSDAATRVVL